MRPSSSRTQLVFLSLVALLLGTASCAPRVDRSDPKAVALAFFKAVAANNRDGAIQYVAPREQEKWKQEWGKKYFQDEREQFRARIPERPELEVRIKGDRADVNVLNAEGLGLDMILEDGQWWVVR